MVVPEKTDAARTGAPRPTTAQAEWAEGWRPFVTGALTQLGLVLDAEDAQRLTVRDPAATGAAGSGNTSRGWSVGLKSRRPRPAAESASGVVFESGSSAELLEWTLHRLADDERLGVFVPRGEPGAVHEIVAPLFEAYTVDGGSVHLAGCHLELTPLLRLTRIDTTAASPTVSHRFFDAAGDPLADAVVRQLHLNDAAPPPDAKPRPAREDWREPIAKASPGEACGTVVASLVVAKRAHGKLEATIGDESADVEFDGWARTLTPPPAVCPQTGAETFHLTLLGDGRIAAAEQAVLCGETGEQILRSDAVACSVTGKTVAADCCEPCPVTGGPTLPIGFAECPRCGQRVSRVTLTKRGCEGCETLATAEASDPRLAAVKAAAPKLSQNKGWRLAETNAVLLGETGGWLSRVLVVVDKETGKRVHAARRTGLAGVWRPLPEGEARQRLG